VVLPIAGHAAATGRPTWGRVFVLPDYVVLIGVPDLDTYEGFVTARLGAVPGIAKVTRISR
jgi:hypothetical protein